MTENTKQFKQFIEKHPLAVLSTASKNGECWGAALYIYCEADQENIRLFFMTRNTALKYKNLQENNFLSLTFFGERTADTLQVAGTVREVEQPQQRLEVLGHLSAVANERLDTWAPVFQLDSGTVRVMEVLPEYIRLSRFGTGKPEILAEEIKPNEV